MQTTIRPMPVHSSVSWTTWPSGQREATKTKTTTSAATAASKTALRRVWTAPISTDECWSEDMWSPSMPEPWALVKLTRDSPDSPPHCRRIWHYIRISADLLHAGAAVAIIRTLVFPHLHG